MPESRSPEPRHDIDSLRLAATARRALDRATDYAPSVAQALERTSLLLRSGRTNDANRLFSFVTDALAVLLYTSEAVKSHLHGEEASELGALSDELCPWLGQIEQAQLASDWLRLADYLEYEVKPVLDRWGERARAHRARETRA